MANRTDPRPNLLLFMPDQLRADAVSTFALPGSAVAQTPVLDALAERATAFTSAWSQHPVCGPSRASIMTGWYPHVAGHRSLTTPLRDDEPNLLRICKDAGYHVASAGNRGDTLAPGVTESSTYFSGWLDGPRVVDREPAFKAAIREALGLGDLTDADWAVWGRYTAEGQLQRTRPDLVGRAASVRTDRWTYVHRLEEAPELYDRRADPFETVNLAGLAAHTDGEEQLRRRLLEWLLDTADLLPERDEPRFPDIPHGWRTEAVPT